MRRLIFFIFKPQSKILNVFSQYRMTFTQHTGVTMSVLVLEIRTVQYFDTAEASRSFSAAERRVEFHWLDSPCPEIHTTLWTSYILIIDNKAGVNFLWGFCGPWGVDFWMVAVRCCDTRTHTRSLKRVSVRNRNYQHWNLHASIKRRPQTTDGLSRGKKR